MSEPAQKCENKAIFKQNNALELFISLKMAISCCFGWRGNLDLPDFLQIKFYDINFWVQYHIKMWNDALWLVKTCQMICKSQS